MQILPGSAGPWLEEIPCRRWRKKHPLGGPERENLLCLPNARYCSRHSLASDPLLLGPHPALALALGYFDSVRLGRDVGLFWEVCEAACSGLSLLPQMGTVAMWGLGGLPALQEARLRGRPREPRALGGGVQGAWRAGDPAFAPCPASLHSQMQAGAGH